MVRLFLPLTFILQATQRTFPGKPGVRECRFRDIQTDFNTGQRGGVYPQQVTRSSRKEKRPRALTFPPTDSFKSPISLTRASLNCGGGSEQPEATVHGLENDEIFHCI